MANVAEELVTALLDAETEEARQALLSKSENIASELAEAIVLRCDDLRLHGELAKALTGLHFARSLVDRFQDPRTLGSVLHTLGVLHDDMADYREAQECLHQSLAIREKLGDLLPIARSWNSIGIVSMNRGDYQQALQALHRSLAIREGLPGRPGLDTTLTNIGIVFHKQGNYEQALDHFVRSLTLAEEAGDELGIADNCHNIGAAHEDQGNYEQALEYYRKSLAICENLGDKQGIAQTLHNIGIAFGRQDQREQALCHLRLSLTLSETLEDKGMIAETLCHMAGLHEKNGDHQLAWQSAEQAARLSGEIGMPHLLWQALSTAGEACRQLGQLGQARQALEASVAVIEQARLKVGGGELERQRFFENKIAPYQALVRLLAAEGDVEAAVAYAEHAKARVLLEVQQGERIGLQDSLTPTEREQERRLRAETVRLNRETGFERGASQSAQVFSALRRARLVYEAFQTQLYALHPQEQSQAEDVPLLTNEELRSLLQQTRSAFLEFVVMEDRTFLFLATLADGENGPQVLWQTHHCGISRDDLALRVGKFHDALADRRGGYQDQARFLCDLLLPPDLLRAVGGTLILVPDGPLWNLPFQALMPGKDRFLLEDFALLFAPSATSLRQSLHRAPDPVSSSSTLLAFGNPDSRLLSQLPEAEAEVRQIGDFYGEERSRILTGGEARERTAKLEAQHYDILHFATHGFLDPVNPMYSGVVLAGEPDETEDGLLEAWEILSLPLKAKMVVLSACDTGRGRMGAGEGLIGLAWAFMIAGCPNMAVSQWRVDSESTRQLMVCFHQALPAEPSLAHALRQAALTVRRSPGCRHPYYWAGFLLVGTGG